MATILVLVRSLKFSLSLPSIVSVMAMFESRQCFGKKMLWRTGKKNSKNSVSRYNARCDVTEITLNTVLETIQVKSQ